MRYLVIVAISYWLICKSNSSTMCRVTGALAELKVKVAPNFAAIFKAQIIVQNQMESLFLCNGCRFFHQLRAKVGKNWTLLAAP